ncbi:3-deoxy-manno-octulosonate cytidylyltransferase [Adhaeribacter aerolatus]|uniref:3-deoxy-manno-octulosonate cytidylyltransferase n=1 Tax=Adhaeribacter aerolatus TaxID=670289 RepID=A0A512AY39_9BACT|nr:glycosyltransferase family protein [Adhaeribacter aerolatus]GEO04642.1 3-deoxy-manno-octulosonate cytidylyltransferase [Adhaeribacter aerolatus]
MSNPLNIGIISQARVTSTRLPGKVLLPIGGKPVLQYHLERLQKSNLPVFIATTTNASDEPIVAFAQAQHIPVYRGDEQNVLSRYYECARQNNLAIIIRVTSDCPLIDGDLISAAVQNYSLALDKNLYYSNCLVRTFPRGFDFEIFSFALLEEAYYKATRPAELEHVTPYINQNQSGQVRLGHFTQPEDKSQYRITLDTPEDFELIRILIEQYQAQNLSAAEIIKLLDAHPELVRINAQVEQKKL